MDRNKKNFEVVGSFPSPFYPKSIKEEDAYGLQYAKAMLSEFSNRNSLSLDSRRERIQYLRRLRMGVQNPYEFIDLAKDDDANTYVNLDLSPPPVIPKFVDILVNKILQQQYYVKITSSDKFSAQVRNAFKQKMLSDIYVYEAVKAIGRDLGFEEVQPIPPLFSHPDDIELHMMTDFKLSIEIAAEKGVDFILNSQHDYVEILKSVINDICTVDLACTKVEYNHDDSVSLRYVDVENAIYSFSPTGDFKKIQHAGELKVMTISELRRVSGLDEECLIKIAKSVAGKLNNPDTVSQQSGYNSFNQLQYNYDSFQVTVLDFQFLSSCELVYEKKETKSGYYRMLKRDESYEPPKNSIYKREVKKKQYTAKFGGCWVVGTDYVYNYGAKTSPLRKHNNLFETELDYTFYSTSWQKGLTMSMVERMEVYAKQMANAHIKLQQMIAKARPNGIAVDISGLKEIDLDGTGAYASPLKLQAVYDQTGNIYYNSVGEDGEVQPRLPLSELNNGISINGIRALIDAYNFNLQVIRDVTGLNDVVDSSSPNSEALVGVQQNAIQAANNATYSIAVAWKNITRRTAEKVLLCLQESIRKNKNIYADVIGEGSAEVLSILQSFPKSNFITDVELAPTQEEIIILEQNINAAIQAGRLMPEDTYLVRNAKNFKVAQLTLAMKAKRFMETMRQQQQEDMALKSQLDQQSAIVASQAKQETIKIELEAEMAKINAKHLSERSLYSLKGEIDMNRDRQKIEGEKEIAALSVNKKFELQEFMEDRRDERQRQGKSMDSEMIEQRKKGLEAKDFTQGNVENPAAPQSRPKVPSAQDAEKDFSRFMGNFSTDNLAPEPQDEMQEDMAEGQMQDVDLNM
jgi:hypothetical protein